MSKEAIEKNTVSPEVVIIEAAPETIVGDYKT